MPDNNPNNNNEQMSRANEEIQKQKAKEMQKIVNDSIKLSKKYQQEETKKCTTLFDEVTKAAANASTILQKHFSETCRSINSLTTKAKKAKEEQEKEMKKNLVADINPYLPTLDECMINLDKIINDLLAVTNKTGTIATYTNMLSTKHGQIFDKIIKYRTYWLNKIETKYKKVINELNIISQTAIPSNVDDESNLSKVEVEIINMRESLKSKHEKHLRLINELREAYIQGNMYARNDLRRKFINPPKTDVDTVSESDAQKIEKNPELQKKEIKELSSTQKAVQRQLDNLKKLMASKPTKPDCLNGSPMLNIKGVKKHELIGKPLFYIMGVLNGLKIVMGILQKQISQSIAGYDKEIFNNKHRKLVLAKKITKTSVKIGLQTIAVAGALTGIAAGVFGIMDEMYEALTSALWLASAALYSVNDFASSASMISDFGDIETMVDTLEANLSDLPEIENADTMNKRFDEWKTNGKVSAPTEESTN